MRSLIIIRSHQCHVTRKPVFLSDVRGMCGGGFRNAFAGHTIQEAATTAARLINIYGLPNRKGFSSFIPPEIERIMPELSPEP